MIDTSISNINRIVSGMRPTGVLHLGHYHGVLKNWLNLQHEYESFFFVADWHALTTNYEDSSQIAATSIDMVADWLAVGLNPSSCKIFVQSMVPEHAELHVLLSMLTPLGWLERVPTYKDQQEKLKEKDLATYGFLGYPLLQSADVLLYKANGVPVGEDQVAHIELTRDVAARFNHIYGKGIDFEQRAQEAISKLGKKAAKLYRELQKDYQEVGNKEALVKGQAFLEEQAGLSMGDKARLLGYLEGVGRTILIEPKALLTECAKMPGLDGQKMSNSYGNFIGLTEEAENVRKKIKLMPTDPARVKRDDPGTPEKCPVWALHKIYADAEQKKWVQQGCTSAGIGCVDCKAVLADNIVAEQAPIIARSKELKADLRLVQEVIEQGSAKARDIAKTTLREVKESIGLIK